jgi:hypothetical protein
MLLDGIETQKPGLRLGLNLRNAAACTQEDDFAFMSS